MGIFIASTVLLCNFSKFSRPYVFELKVETTCFYLPSIDAKAIPKTKFEQDPLSMSNAAANTTQCPVH